MLQRATMQLICKVTDKMNYHRLVVSIQMEEFFSMQRVYHVTEKLRERRYILTRNKFNVQINIIYLVIPNSSMVV